MMSIQSKLRELIHSRAEGEHDAGHADAHKSHAVPAPGHPTGAEGGDDSPAADTSPALPAHDGSPLGDTDQHSQAYRPSERS
jgi:hypothetical protein